MAPGPYRHRRVAARTIRTSPIANTCYLNLPGRGTRSARWGGRGDRLHDPGKLLQLPPDEDRGDQLPGCFRCPSKVSNRPLLAQGVVLGSFGVLLPISRLVPNRSAPSPTNHETVETLVAVGLYGDTGQVAVARLAARSRLVPGKTFQYGPRSVEYLPEIGPLTTFGAGLGPRSWPRLLWLTDVSFWARLSRSTSPPRPG